MFCQLGRAIIDPPRTLVREPVHGSTSTKLQVTCLTSSCAVILIVTLTGQLAPGWQALTGVSTTASTKPALRGATAFAAAGAGECGAGLGEADREEVCDAGGVAAVP